MIVQKALGQCVVMTRTAHSTNDDPAGFMFIHSLIRCPNIKQRVFDTATTLLPSVLCKRKPTITQIKDTDGSGNEAGINHEPTRFCIVYLEIQQVYSIPKQSRLLWYLL